MFPYDVLNDCVLKIKQNKKKVTTHTHHVTHAYMYIYKVFGAKIPDHLVSVHIRWGDKGKEMQLVPIERYVEAVRM